MEGGMKPAFIAFIMQKCNLCFKNTSEKVFLIKRHLSFKDIIDWYYYCNLCCTIMSANHLNNNEIISKVFSIEKFEKYMTLM